MKPRRAALGCAVAIIALAPARSLVAQQNALGPYAELRADAVAASHTAATVGAGVELPFGAYVRLGVDASAGASFKHAASVPVGRLDVVPRFLLDPFRQVPVGLSIGAGLSLPVERGMSRVRPRLVAVADIEGRRRGAWTPALQLGLGGGARLGLALRRSPRLFR